MLSEPACCELMHATHETPTALMGTLCDQAVHECQVLWPCSKICDDGCRSSLEDGESGLMRESCIREQLQGPVELAQFPFRHARFRTGVVFV